LKSRGPECAPCSLKHASECIAETWRDEQAGVPRAAIEGKTDLGKADVLLMAKGNHGIDTRGPARGNPAGDQRDDQQEGSG
jgi:hypothetical protein